MLNFSSIECDHSNPLDKKYSTNFLGLNSPGLGISTTPTTSISTMPTITAFTGRQLPSCSNVLSGTNTSRSSHNNRHNEEQQTSICSLGNIPSDIFSMQPHNNNNNNNDFHSGQFNDQQNNLPDNPDDIHHHHSHNHHHHQTHLLDLPVQSQPHQDDQSQQIFSQQIDLELEENPNNQEDQLELEQEQLSEQDIDLDQPQRHTEQQQEYNQDQLQQQYPPVTQQQNSQTQKLTESVFNDEEFNLNSPHDHYTSNRFQSTTSIVHSKKYIQQQHQQHHYHHQNISQNNPNICHNNNNTTHKNNNNYLNDFCEQFGFESVCDQNSQSKRESFVSSSSSSRIANLTESESSSLPRRRVVHMQQLAKSGIFDCEDPTNQEIDLGLELQEVQGIMNKQRLQQEQEQQQHQQQQLRIPFSNNDNEAQYYLTDNPSDCLINDNNNIQDSIHNTNICFLPSSELHPSELLIHNNNHSNENLDNNQNNYKSYCFSNNTSHHINSMKVYQNDGNNKIPQKNILNRNIQRFEESKQQQQQQLPQQIFAQPQRLGVRLTPYIEEDPHGVSSSYHPTILGFSPSNLSFMLRGDILIDLSQLAELLKQKDFTQLAVLSSSSARSSIPEFNLNSSGKPTCNSSVNNISGVRFKNSALNYWKRCTRVEKDSSENGCYYISLDSRPEKPFSSISAIRQCLMQLKRRRIALNQQLSSVNIELFDSAAERIEVMLETVIRKEAAIGSRQSQPSLPTVPTAAGPGCVSQSSPNSSQILQTHAINRSYPQPFNLSHNTNNTDNSSFPRQSDHPSNLHAIFRSTHNHTNSSKYPIKQLNLSKQSQHLRGGNQSHSSSRKPPQSTPICNWIQCQKQARMILKELVNTSGSNKSFVFGQIRSGESSISQQIYSPKLISILFGSKQPSSQFSSQLLRRGLVSLFDPHSAHALTLLSMNNSCNSSSNQHNSSNNGQVKSGKISLTLFTADDFQIPITVTLRSYNLNHLVGKNHSSGAGNNNNQVSSQTHGINQSNNNNNSNNSYNNQQQQDQNYPYSLHRHPTNDNNSTNHQIHPQQHSYSNHQFNTNLTHYSSKSHNHHTSDDRTANNQLPNNFENSFFFNTNNSFNPHQSTNQIQEEIYLPSEHINSSNVLSQDHSDIHILDVFDIKIKIKYQKQLKTFRESLVPLPLRKSISKTSTNCTNERTNMTNNNNNNNNHNHENDQSSLNNSANPGQSYCEGKSTSLQADDQKPTVVVLQGGTNISNNTNASTKKQDLYEISKCSQSLSYYRDTIGFLTRFYPDKLSSNEKLQQISLLKQI